MHCVPAVCLNSESIFAGPGPDRKKLMTGSNGDDKNSWLGKAGACSAGQPLPAVAAGSAASLPVAPGDAGLAGRAYRHRQPLPAATDSGFSALAAAARRPAAARWAAFHFGSPGGCAYQPEAPSRRMSPCCGASPKRGESKSLTGGRRYPGRRPGPGRISVSATAGCAAADDEPPVGAGSWVAKRNVAL